MANSYQNQDYQKIVNNLFCTDKGKEVLNSDEDALAKRDRQFLLLLANDDTVSRRVCVGLAHKVSLFSMLEEGLLDCFVKKDILLKSLESSSQNGQAPKIASKDIVKEQPEVVNSVTKSMDDNLLPEPDVMVAAGVFI